MTSLFVLFAILGGKLKYRKLFANKLKMQLRLRVAVLLVIAEALKVYRILGNQWNKRFIPSKMADLQDNAFVQK